MTTTTKEKTPARTGARGNETGEGFNNGGGVRLNVDRLAKVRHANGKTIAQCPACREAGNDDKGDHLFIAPDGRFGCVMFPGTDGDQHRKRIYELAGNRDQRPHKATTTTKGKTIHATVDKAANAAIWGLNQSGGEWSEVMRHAYSDHQGVIYAYVIRLNDGDEKQFCPIHRNGTGWSVGDPARWLPYRVNELDAAGPVHVFEGEKCADAAASIGLKNCITSSHGAKSAAMTDWRILAGRHVVIHPDNDDAGRDYANDAARLMLEMDPPAKVLIAPVLGNDDGYDVADLVRDAGPDDAVSRVIDAAFNAVEIIPSAIVEPITMIGLPKSMDVTIWHDAELPSPDPVLVDAFDLATKALVVGPSKARKSFFLLQMMLAIAAGKKSFLAWEIKQARRVLFLNLEIPPAHFQRRVRRMMHAMGITPADLGGRFHLINARGLEPDEQTAGQIIDRCQDHGAEIFCADPIYKLMDGDESKQEHVKPLLRLFDHIANDTGATILYSHHGTKGIAGDRQTIDRAAGSGLLARDFDWMVSLAHHQSHRDTGLMVAEQIARSYPPMDGFSIRWDDAGFFVTDDAEPILLTSRNADRTGKTGATLTADDALAVICRTGATFAGLYHEALRQKGFSHRAAHNVTDELLRDGRLIKLPVGYPRKVIIGTPAQIESKRGEQ